MLKIICEKIYQIREAHHEVSKLLGTYEKPTLDVEESFEPFFNVNALEVSEYQQSLWQAAKEQYEERMLPLEEQTGQKLKEVLGTSQSPACWKCGPKIWVIVIALIDKYSTGQRVSACTREHDIYSNIFELHLYYI